MTKNSHQNVDFMSKTEKNGLDNEKNYRKVNYLNYVSK